MKVFKFDPKTGKRKEKLFDSPLATYASQWVNHLVSENKIKPIEFKVPNGDWKVHCDAGYIEKGGKDESLLCNDWICFCTGQVVIGKDVYWDWVVLPPKQEIVWI